MYEVTVLRHKLVEGLAMGEAFRRAIAAGISPRGVEALRDILPECGYALADATQDGPAGLRLLEALQPELAVVGAAMPGMDGMAFVRRARALRLDIQPAIVLLRPQGMGLPGESTLGALGAAVIDQPPGAEALVRALEGLREWRRTLPPDRAERLEALLDAVGVPRHPGRDCLIRAITCVWHDRRRVRGLKKGLYPDIARQTGLTPAQVERAMRHAIEVAWRTGEIEQQHRIFGDTIDARRGKPTCGEMIAQLAEELRWEGRQ